MKTHIKYLLGCMLLGMVFSANAQKEETWKDAVIFEFQEPYSQITLNFDEEDFVFNIEEDTKFMLTKKKSIPKDEIFTGSTVNVTFVIENRARSLVKLQFSTEEYGDEKKFEGVFESFSENSAIIDGRKVLLTESTAIKCKGAKNCNCSKGRSFLGFDEIPMGSFLTVNGIKNETGTYTASKIEVCKNTFTKNDEQLMLELTKSFDASNLKKMSRTSSAAFNIGNGLHNGNIQIGSVSYKLLDDINVQGYVNMIGNKILPAYTLEESYAQEHDVLFRFYVIENEVPNAFAFPNGMIFIHTGLLKLMENEAQIAAVLGHEIAHVTNEHGAKRYKTTKIANSGMGKKTTRWLKKAFKKKVNVEEGSILGNALDTALEYTTPENVMNLFNKKHETQSDRVGLFYMSEAGYDPREAAKFWQIMMANTKNQKFMNRIFNATLQMVNTLEGELDELKTEDLGKEGMDILVGAILETVYTSHPLSVKRYGDINRLLSTTYETMDYDTMEIGREDFEKYLKKLK